MKFHDAFTDDTKITLVLEFMNAGSLAVGSCVVFVHPLVKALHEEQ